MIRLITIRGIEIALNPMLLAALLLLVLMSVGPKLMAGAAAGPFTFMDFSPAILLSGILLSMSLHELGHALMARLAGVPQVVVELSVVGRTRFFNGGDADADDDASTGEDAEGGAESDSTAAELQAAPPAPRAASVPPKRAAHQQTGLAHTPTAVNADWTGKEWLIALGGPLVNLVIFLALTPYISEQLGISLWHFLSTSEPVDTRLLGSLAPVLGWLGWINLGMAVINLIPLLPLDGSRVLLGLGRAFDSRPAVLRMLIAASVLMGGSALLLGGARLALGAPFSLINCLVPLLGVYALIGSASELRRLRAKL